MSGGQPYRKSQPGMFAEWLVGRAPGVIKDGYAKVEWDRFNLRYGDTNCGSQGLRFSATLGIPTAGRSRGSTSPPANGCGPQGWTHGNVSHPPRRPADVYVFCLHKAVPADNENVQDPDCWAFWGIPIRKLDDELGDKKSLGGVSTLDRFTTCVKWSKIRLSIQAAL